MSLNTIADHIRKDPFAALLGIELLEIGKGTSKVVMTVTAQMLNFQGILHGGVVFALADAAFGAAANSHGSQTVALNVNINFLATAPLGTRLIAEATEEKMGRKTGLYRMSVTTEDGVLVALCHGTAYRKNQPLICSGADSPS